MNRFHALCLAAMVTIIPATANDGPCSELVPPARYATMPTPDYELIVLTSHDDLRLACGGNPYFACALTSEPVILMMSDNYIAEAAGDFYRGRRWKACLLTHEIAHLNGWPGTHPR